MKNAEVSMKNKVVLITGGSGGIGKETALALARMGAEVVIVGRSREKTAAAAEEICRVTGNLAVGTLVGDLSYQADVHRVAQEFRGRYQRLDVLVNNAGGVFMHREESKDGIEMTFALNHLNYFLLTHLVLDQLEASAPARIVNVSSQAHMGGKIYFEDLELRRGYSGWKAYSQSKLANLLFTYELARHLEGRGVTVNALHPGFVATNFGKSNGGLFQPLFRLAQIAAISPEAGAQTSVYLASSPEVESVTGKYFDKKKAVRSNPISYNTQVARRLWEMSLAMVQIKEAEQG